MRRKDVVRRLNRLEVAIRMKEKRLRSCKGVREGGIG